MQKTKQRYPAYKPTNIDWIGDIPVDWEVRKLKQFFVFEKGKNAGSFTQEYVNDEANTWEYPVYSWQTENNWVMGMINSYIYDFEKVLFTTTVGAKVMTPMCLGWKFSLSQNCVLMVRSDKSVEEKYIYYQLFPLFKRKLDDIPSHMQPSLRISDLNKFSIIFPPLTEQQAIADYLDTKTVQIDQIISLKQQQIELLKERRTALINHVVTKGLDPKVEMVDSGIEWIGMIPKGWEVNKIKWFITIASGTSLSNEKFDEFGSYSVVWWNGEMWKSNEYNCEWNVIVVWRVWAHCWNIHIIKERTWITDNALIIDRINWFDLEYLATILRIRGLNDIASKNAQPLITWTQVKEQFVCKPTIKEQQAIVDYLDSKTSQIEQTITAVKKSIELLTEYKQSLISHVVTGKVKVF